MKLNTLGKLAVAGYVGVTGFQLYNNVRNSGGVPASQIIKMDLLTSRQLVVLGALALFVWFCGRA